MHQICTVNIYCIAFVFFNSAKPDQQKFFLLNGMKIETDQQCMIMTFEFKLQAHFLDDLITIYSSLYSNQFQIYFHGQGIIKETFSNFRPVMANMGPKCMLINDN